MQLHGNDTSPDRKQTNDHAVNSSWMVLCLSSKLLQGRRLWLLIPKYKVIWEETNNSRVSDASSRISLDFDKLRCGGWTITERVSSNRIYYKYILPEEKTTKSAKDVEKRLREECPLTKFLKEQANTLMCQWQHQVALKCLIMMITRTRSHRRKIRLSKALETVSISSVT